MATLPGVRRPASQPRVSAGPAAAGAVRNRGVPRALPTGWGVIRKRISRLMLISMLLLAIAAVGLVQVLQTTRVAEVGYQLRALEVERQSLDASIRLLEAQIAQVSNLERLRLQAVTRLGMVPPETTMRIAVQAQAPAKQPLPRRYVHLPAREPIPQPAWWEELIGSIPGFQ
jgi:cell division protein FtsL